MWTWHRSIALEMVWGNRKQETKCFSVVTISQFCWFMSYQIPEISVGSCLTSRITLTWIHLIFNTVLLPWYISINKNKPIHPNVSPYIIILVKHHRCFFQGPSNGFHRGILHLDICTVGFLLLWNAARGLGLMMSDDVWWSCEDGEETWGKLVYLWTKSVVTAGT